MQIKMRIIMKNIGTLIRIQRQHVATGLLSALDAAAQAHAATNEESAQLEALERYRRAVILCLRD
jgi:F0F1-type ATP synthase membrane subunit b/b'